MNQILDLLETYIKHPQGIPQKQNKLDMVQFYIQKYDFEQAIKMIDDNLSTLCSLLGQQVGDTVSQIEELLAEILFVVGEVFTKRQFLEGLSTENKIWWQLYYPAESNPKKTLSEDASSIDSDSSFVSRNNINLNENELNLRLLPSPSELQHCLLKFEGKGNTHVDFLIRIIRLIQALALQFENLLSTRKQIDQLKYVCQLQQTNLMFLLTRLSKPQSQKYKYDSHDRIEVNMERIPPNEVKFFNEEFQSLIREFHNEFRLIDLEKFKVFLGDESFKWLFKRLQDRYERSLEQMMKTGQPLSIFEKDYLLNQLEQCISILKDPHMSSVLGLSLDLLVPEILGYFDEIITIVQAAESSTRLSISILKIFQAISSAFRMIQSPFDKSSNYYTMSSNLAMYPLRERTGQTQLNMIMGERFNMSMLSELYAMHVLSKEQRALIYQYNQLSKSPLNQGYDFRVHIRYLTILSTYLLIEDSNNYVQSVAISNPKVNFISCGLISYLTQLKFNLKPTIIKQGSNLSLSEKLFKEFNALYLDLKKLYDENPDSLVMLRPDYPTSSLDQCRVFLECLRLCIAFEQLGENDSLLKKYFILYKTIKLQETLQSYTDIKITEKGSATILVDHNQNVQIEELIDKEYEIFQLPFPMLVAGIAELFSLIHLLKQKQYLEFLENQYYFHLNLLKRICFHLRKNYYNHQVWKYMVLLIDITQRVINMVEMFQISWQLFKDDPVARSNFSFSHVSRGLKILRIILEETILRVFCDVQSDEPTEKVEFKPKIKVIFHGLDDLDIENPRQGDLDLEIVMQTSHDQFIRLRVQDDHIKLGYNHIEKLNLITNVLLPILMYCIDFWIKYIPKEFNEYIDSISKQTQDVDKTIMSQWVLLEKAHLKNVHENLHGFVESVEFWLMKTEGSLMKEINLYSQRPLSHQFELLAKYLTEQGINVDHNLIQTWEKKIQTSLRSQLDSYIGPIKTITQKIKIFQDQMKKFPK